MNRLEQSVSDLIDTRVIDGEAYPGLFLVIGVMVRYKETSTEDSGSHHKLSASPHPGNAKMAGYLGDVRAGAREAEQLLRESLGFAPVDRGGSDGNTIRALRALPDLSTAFVSRFGPCPRGPQVGTQSNDLGVRHGAFCQPAEYWPCVVLAAVQHWADQARVILDISEQWSPVPQDPARPVVCPFCSCFSLRWMKAARRMKCANSACVDPAGNRPVWDAADLEFLAHEIAVEPVAS